MRVPLNHPSYITILSRRRYFSLLYHLTLKKTIWNIHRTYFVQARRAGTSYYELQLLHREWNRAVPILSFHLLCFQILEIHLPQWHHHCSSTNSQPSSKSYWNLTMHHLHRHWCCPTCQVETRTFLNPRPVVIRMFPKTERLRLG